MFQVGMSYDSDTFGYAVHVHAMKKVMFRLIPGPDERNSQHADADHGPDGRAASVGLKKELVGRRTSRSFFSFFFAKGKIKDQGPKVLL